MWGMLLEKPLPMDTGHLPQALLPPLVQTPLVGHPRCGGGPAIFQLP